LTEKKWQHIAIFCVTGLVSCVKGKVILAVLHPSGASIEPNPERTEWICFPGSQIYESSMFLLSFFPKLAAQENRQKKKKKRRSKPKRPRPLADQTFTDKTITRKKEKKSR
jgi:hypothetical protein